MLDDESLWCEHKIWDEGGNPGVKGEKLLFAILFVHGFHDLGYPGHDGFVVAVLVELLELSLGAGGVE